MVDTPNNPTFSNIERVTRISVNVKNAAGKFIQIGSIQSINPSESRDVTPHFTLGGEVENPKAMIPNLVRDKRLDVSMLAIWKNNLLQAWANNSGDDPFLSLVDQKNPFQIQVTKKKADNKETLTLTYDDCFISNHSATQDIARGDVTIIETATIVFRKVTGAFVATE